MTRAEYEALAQRVETEEPSEELAAAVWRAVGRAVHFSTVYGHFFAGTNSDQPITDPLRSLDAAVTVVRANWQWEVRSHGAAWCTERNTYREVKGHADRRPAAALTAAALRALAQEANHD